MSEQKNLYKEAGVDIERGDALVNWLQDDKSDRTHGLGEVVSGIGGFSALFRPNFSGMKDPLIVSGTDGVGTKVLLGIETDKLEGLGVDLVSMCVNDLYTIGAQPLFFLDYYATGVLNESQFKRILTGIKQALQQCHAMLLGGETAELPGLYTKGHFDLAGFIVGVVDGVKRIHPGLVGPGDVIVSFASSGFHSNGYSLIRKWLDKNPADSATLDNIMTPTKVYGNIPSLLQSLPDNTIHALANITGGGISGNLPRVLPEGVVANIEQSKVPVPDWMMSFCHANGAEFQDVENVFNMGAGMIAVVARDSIDAVMSQSKSLGLQPTIIGEISSGLGSAHVKYC